MVDDGGEVYLKSNKQLVHRPNCGQLMDVFFPDNSHKGCLSEVLEEEFLLLIGLVIIRNHSKIL